MKLILMTILVVAAPPWLATTIAGPAVQIAPEVGTQIVVECITTSEGEGEGSGPCGMVSMGEGHGMFVVRVADGEDSDEGESTHRIMFVGRGDDSARKNRGWFGVSIGQVSKAMQDQLDLEDRGLLLLGVVKGSPADEAGLKAHDVLLEIDGKTFSSEVGSGAALLRAYQPGDEVELLFLRDGREESVIVELGSQKDSGHAFTFDWTFDGEPTVELEERIHTRGKMISRGPNGTWVFKDLGDLSTLEDLPFHVRMLMPVTGTTATQVFVHKDGNMVKTAVKHNGESMTVQRQGDGPITVTRVDEDGEEVTDSYDTPEELEDADIEAFNVFNSAGRRALIHLNLDGLHEGLKDLDFDFKFDFDTEEWAEHAEQFEALAEEWREKMESGVEDAQRVYEEAMETFHEKLGGAFDAKDFHFQALQVFNESKDSAPRMFFRGHGKPKHSFELKADGTIEVRIRKGDGELLQKFSDEDDLADRRPDLFDKYQELLDVDEDRE